MTRTHKLDTEERVFFYEQEFYVLSNYSSFNLEWKGHTYDTAEAAYHSEKFEDNLLKGAIRLASSAHEAQKIAQHNTHKVRPNWPAIRTTVMKDILRAKVYQHEYVRRKLLETGDRELIEDSWRDDFWGWGANRDGHNMLGRLWMEVRTELRSAEDQNAHPDR